ncbi:hypothetical protein CCAX7_58600 [Capsulimonas corticalis]|uniref:DUF1854 domain-containing protein n=1 Tax=Capsulimonas corticalis TaxID=2219043 RepID=A0A402CZX3_9BACT|nr:DUF1854 domain-containing protein [Capsulimonas corticalis]BDI33809.1 hypothetical protein CCAX7_58600 [Capsulimonas corticalis]
MNFEPTIPNSETTEERNPFAIRFLEPSQVRLFHSDPSDAAIRLTLEGELSWRSVRIARAFPFSDPEAYIGLRDEEDEDIGIVRDLKSLDAESRAVATAALDRRYFTPKVLKVHSVSEKSGSATFDVETDRGPVRFVVRSLRDNSFSMGPNRLMLVDSEGGRYEFPDITAYGGKAYYVLSKVM